MNLKPSSFIFIPSGQSRGYCLITFVSFSLQPEETTFLTSVVKHYLGCACIHGKAKLLSTKHPTDSAQPETGHRHPGHRARAPTGTCTPSSRGTRGFAGTLTQPRAPHGPAPTVETAGPVRAAPGESRRCSAWHPRLAPPRGQLEETIVTLSTSRKWKQRQNKPFI